MEESKEVQTEQAFKKLITNLDELMKQYRGMLDVLRKEQEALVKADLKGITESHQNKEALLYKIRGLDSARERYAKELGWLLDIESTQPRLLEIATKMSSENGDKLRRMHAGMDILVRKVVELNRDNETYTTSALNTLNGALGEIKDTVSGKKTYEKKGKMNYGPDKAGNFVSKEA